MRWQPAVRTLPPYYDDPVYIDALAERRSTRASPALDFEPEMVLASFHGLPRDYLDKGDPYHCQCQKTTRLLRERLGWPDERLPHHLPVALRPRRVAAALHRRDASPSSPRAGVKRIAVIMPGFSADCLETLEEIAHPRRRDVPRERRRRASPPSPASTTARTACG